MSAQAEAPAGTSYVEEQSLPPGSPDWVLVGAVLALTAIGLVFVYSSSFALSLQLYGDTRFFITRQLIGATVGLAAFAAFAALDYRIWRKAALPLILLALLGLVLVAIPGIGYEQNGARRWLQIAPLPALQPSEFAKFAIIIYLATWMASKGWQIRNPLLGVLPFAAMLAAVGVLLMLEPDLGTFVAIAFVATVMFMLAGAPWRHLFFVALGGVGAFVTIVFGFSYGIDRVRGFFRAEEFSQEVGFQIVNLVTTLGSGGLTGVGIGESRQKFFYVPSAHADGVFAIIGEETGLLGALMLLGIMAILIYRGIRTGLNAPDRFGTLLAFGIVGWFAIQAFLNIAGITRMTFLTGIPLPFLSFGGSALIAALAGAGVLVSISRRGRVATAGYAAADPFRDQAPALEPELDQPLDDPYPGRKERE